MSETVKPSQTEDDYFAKEDAEKKRKLALKVQPRHGGGRGPATQGTAPGALPQLRPADARGEAPQASPVDVCFACNGIFLEAHEIETFQRQINEGRRGVVAAILNWLKPESGQK